MDLHVSPKPQKVKFIPPYQFDAKEKRTSETDTRDDQQAVTPLEPNTKISLKAALVSKINASPKKKKRSVTKRKRQTIESDDSNAAETVTADPPQESIPSNTKLIPAIAAPLPYAVTDVIFESDYTYAHWANVPPLAPPGKPHADCNYSFAGKLSKFNTSSPIVRNAI